MLARHGAAGICSSVGWRWGTGGSQKDTGMNQKLRRGTVGWKKSGTRLAPGSDRLHVHTCVCVRRYMHVVPAVSRRTLSP